MLLLYNWEFGKFEVGSSDNEDCIVVSQAMHSRFLYSHWVINVLSLSTCSIITQANSVVSRPFVAWEFFDPGHVELNRDLARRFICNDEVNWCGAASHVESDSWSWRGSPSSRSPCQLDHG